MAGTPIHSEAYKIQCRAIWYDNGCPSPKKCMELKIMPPDEQGKDLAFGTLRHWITDDGWHEWKDNTDAALSVRVENELLGRKIVLIKEQLNQVRLVKKVAFEDITEKGFDTSAAATKALFESFKEERGLLQIEKMIEELAERDTSDLQRQFRELAERAESTEIVEEDSAESIDT